MRVKEKNMTKNTNGTTVKDLVLMVREDLRKDLLRIEAKIDLHVQIDDKERGVFVEALAKHDSILKHVCDELPEKGYCAKVDMMSLSLFPKEGPSLEKRVDVLTYDRAMLKWVLATSIGAILLSSATLLIKIIFRF